MRQRPVLLYDIALPIFALVLALTPSTGMAARGDCGQPSTDGATPTATDSLFILRAAVGAVACPFCACDTDGSGAATAGDALRSLKHVVGHSVTVDCTCPPCTSGVITVLPGSRLEMGWNGLAHDQDLPAGGSLTFQIVRRCVDSHSTTCHVDTDCPGGECRPTCNCDDPQSSACEIAEPVLPTRCRRDMSPCETNADCFGSTCERFFATPIPLNAANTPFCLGHVAPEALTGTFDLASGAIQASLALRLNTSLGIANDKPCPRCGAPSQNPKVGQEFLCESDFNDGESCTVSAVSRVFGGVSSDCPERVSRIFSPTTMRLSEVGTGPTSKTAQIPCLVSGICTDEPFAECETNADCLRCTDDFGVCTTNADCNKGASCAAAPEQPITCGIYCHCGFCGNDPTQRCFDDDECSEGQACLDGNSSTGKQDQPNGCNDLLCGRAGEERCCSEGDSNCPAPTTLEGRCSEKEFVACNESPFSPLFGSCAAEAAGECLLEKRSCFEHVIARAGVPSGLGRHCIDDPDVSECASDTDCSIGACMRDTAEPTLVSLLCLGKTASAAVNAAFGVPGPAALTLRAGLRLCRCGDGVVECGEECDDSDLASGDGCDQACRFERPRAPM